MVDFSGDEKVTIGKETLLLALVLQTRNLVFIKTLQAKLQSYYWNYDIGLTEISYKNNNLLICQHTNTRTFV